MFCTSWELEIVQAIPQLKTNQFKVHHLYKIHESVVKFGLFEESMSLVF